MKREKIRLLILINNLVKDSQKAKTFYKNINFTKKLELISKKVKGFIP